MHPKTLIICPFCQEKGKREILGELRDNLLIVGRLFNQKQTIVSSSSMQVICGECKQAIFVRQEANYATASLW